MFAHERTRPKLHRSRTKQVLYKTHAQLSDIEHLLPPTTLRLRSI
jgi:hypothetical protein